jgi:phosphatidylglycerol:prolipoprotein diacylglycerol transferase
VQEPLRVVVPWGVTAHYVLEAIAYAVGFRLYLTARRRAGDVIDGWTRGWMVAAAIAGAAIGSRLAFWLEDPSATLAHWNNPVFLLGGKTIVGGLVGGTIGVEIAKHRLAVTVRTGDLFAVPLAVGIAIGRIGCFLAGLPDGTYGSPTSRAWGVDFGDGVARHPTQIYESIAMAALAVVLARAARRPHREGDVFRWFMVAYMALRVLLDALKPEVRLLLGLSSLQWIALVTALYYVWELRRAAPHSPVARFAHSD